MKLLNMVIIMLMALMMAIACTKKLPETEYYQLATEAFNKQEFEQSIENFQKIIKYYPKGERSSEALFMLGYINANYTNNLEAAEKYYKDFIAQYPEDELADDAQYELDHLGQDINDLPIFKDAPADSAESNPSLE